MSCPVTLLGFSALIVIWINLLSRVNLLLHGLAGLDSFIVVLHMQYSIAGSHPPTHHHVKIESLSSKEATDLSRRHSCTMILLKVGYIAQSFSGLPLSKTKKKNMLSTPLRLQEGMIPTLI